MGEQTIWEKWEAFVAAAKADPAIRITMQKGTPADKIKALQDYGFTNQEIADLESDLTAVSNTSDVSWWSW